MEQIGEKDQATRTVEARTFLDGDKLTLRSRSTTSSGSFRFAWLYIRKLMALPSFLASLAYTQKPRSPANSSSSSAVDLPSSSPSSSSESCYAITCDSWGSTFRFPDGALRYLRKKEEKDASESRARREAKSLLGCGKGGRGDGRAPTYSGKLWSLLPTRPGERRETSFSSQGTRTRRIISLTSK